jgi:hypothetical protein
MDQDLLAHEFIHLLPPSSLFSLQLYKVHFIYWSFIWLLMYHKNFLINTCNINIRYTNPNRDLIHFLMF